MFLMTYNVMSPVFSDKPGMANIIGFKFKVNYAAPNCVLVGLKEKKLGEKVHCHSGYGLNHPWVKPIPSLKFEYRNCEKHFYHSILTRLAELQEELPSE